MRELQFSSTFFRALPYGYRGITLTVLYIFILVASIGIVGVNFTYANATTISPQSTGVNQGAFSSRWWLRTPGEDSYKASYVLPNGEVMEDGWNSFVYDDMDLRPALFINLANITPAQKNNLQVGTCSSSVDISANCFVFGSYVFDVIGVNNYAGTKTGICAVLEANTDGYADNGGVECPANTAMLLLSSNSFGLGYTTFNNTNTVYSTSTLKNSMDSAYNSLKGLQFNNISPTLESLIFARTLKGGANFGSSGGNAVEGDNVPAALFPLSVVEANALYTGAGTPDVLPLFLLSFTDSAAYDIPTSSIGTAIANINVSGGTSGGIMPYTFTAAGLPAGITISTAGVISGTPTATGVAGTATITVTDSASETQSITIAYDEISPATYPTLAQFDEFTGVGTSAARVDADHTKFVRLLKDGMEVDAAHYAITPGSTIITFNESYLQTLANGAHTYTAEFTDGVSEALNLSVNVQAPPAPPLPPSLPPAPIPSQPALPTPAVASVLNTPLTTVADLAVSGIRTWEIILLDCALLTLAFIYRRLFKLPKMRPHYTYLMNKLQPALLDT